MKKLLDAIIKKLLRGGFANDETAEIVRFGLELIIMKTVISSAMIAVAIAMGSLPEVLVFMAVFAPLRNNCGGYHSKTRPACFFTSILILAADIAAVKLIQDRAVILATAIFLILGTAHIISLAPVDTSTKPFDSIERVVFRRRSLLVNIAAVLATTALALFGLHRFALSASCAVLITGTLLAVGRIANKKGVAT